MKYLVPLSFALVMAFVASACSKKIGDACKVTADCAQTDSSRQCDDSQPGGYCIVAGCEEKGCPEDSTCIRFFPPAADAVSSCDPKGEDLTMICPADEVCLHSGMAGVCVRRSTERRYCVQTCGGNSDCRSDYECRETAEPTSIPYVGGSAKYCAPKPKQ